MGKLAAIQGAFYRDYGPNLNMLIATVFIFMLVIFLQGWHVNIGIHRIGAKGTLEPYKIKLFYTSNMPIILMSALISNTWAEISGQSPASVYKQLKDQGYTGKGGD